MAVRCRSTGAASGGRERHEAMVAHGESAGAEAVVPLSPMADGVGLDEEPQGLGRGGERSKLRTARVVVGQEQLLTMQNGRIARGVVPPRLDGAGLQVDAPRGRQGREGLGEEARVVQQRHPRRSLRHLQHLKPALCAARPRGQRRDPPPPTPREPRGRARTDRRRRVCRPRGPRRGVATGRAGWSRGLRATQRFPFCTLWAPGAVPTLSPR
jgi:hypothetical protein